MPRRVRLRSADATVAAGLPLFASRRQRPSGCGISLCAVGIVGRERLQWGEGIALVSRTKEPGPGMALDAVPMGFSYGGSFRTRPAEAYERLVHDAMVGDQTLLLCDDAVERSWEIAAPVLDASGPVHPCAAGPGGRAQRTS